jgi:hypothetical protein
MTDMPSEEFRGAAHEVNGLDCGLSPGHPRLSGTSAGAAGGLHTRSSHIRSRRGEAIDAILGDFRDLVVPAMTHWNHPRFHAYFSVSLPDPGILAEALTAALNVNHMVWKSSPAAAELELVVLGWLRQWLQLPESFFGMIFDTAVDLDDACADRGAGLCRSGMSGPRVARWTWWCTHPSRRTHPSKRARSPSDWDSETFAIFRWILSFGCDPMRSVSAEG